MLTNFFAVDLSGLPKASVPKAEHKMPQKKGTKMITTLGSVMHWILTETLHLYENNRGDGTLSNSTFQSTSQGVDADVIGEVIIGLHKPFGSDEERMTLANGHSRFGGFFQRLLNGELTEDELATPIGVTVAHHFLSAYQRVNAPGSAHRTKDKIKNVNLAYGGILKRIFKAVGEDCKLAIGDNKWTILSSIIYNCLTPNRSWFWPEVYQNRQPAMRKANDLAGSIKVTQADEKRLIVAIDFWFKLMKGLDEQAMNSGVNVKKVIRNAGLFGFIVCDQMRTNSEFSSATVMIKKIIRNLTIVELACPELCRGDRQTVLRYTTELEKILRHRGREAA